MQWKLQQLSKGQAAPEQQRPLARIPKAPRDARAWASNLRASTLIAIAIIAVSMSTSIVLANGAPVSASDWAPKAKLAKGHHSLCFGLECFPLDAKKTHKIESTIKIMKMPLGGSLTLNNTQGMNISTTIVSS